MSWVLNSEAALLTEQFTWSTVSWNCEFGFSWNYLSIEVKEITG